jgi:phosphatidylglycerophosphate synthase
MVTTAVIVGRAGSRGLEPVFGVPAVRRLVLTARRLGVGAVHLLASDDSLRPGLADLIPAGAFHVIAGVPAFDALAAALDVAGGDGVLVMRADHVVDRWTLDRMLHEANGHEAAFGPANGSGGGKYMPGEPVYVVRPERLERLLGAMWSGASCADAGIERADSGLLPVVVGEGPDGARTAEASLLGNLGASTARTDSYLSRTVHRPISRAISSRIAKTAVTPNMVTLFHIVLGLAGALLIATGAYLPQVIGGLLFLSATILDGVDGEVARLTLRERDAGHYLDIVGDNVVHVGIFVGIAVGLFRAGNDPAFLWALALLLPGFGLCALAVERAMGHAPGEQGSRESPWMASLLANRDFAYIVALMALLHRLDWFLFATTAGVYLFALGLLLVAGRRRTSATGDRHSCRHSS